MGSTFTGSTGGLPNLPAPDADDTYLWTDVQKARTTIFKPSATTFQPTKITLPTSSSSSTTTTAVPPVTTITQNLAASDEGTTVEFSVERSAKWWTLLDVSVKSDGTLTWKMGPTSAVVTAGKKTAAGRAVRVVVNAKQLGPFVQGTEYWYQFV